MTIWVGTSGYNYPEWRGSFYPDKFPTAKMLPYYAERFSTVEINYTFYRSVQVPLGLASPSGLPPGPPLEAGPGAARCLPYPQRRPFPV